MRRRPTLYVWHIESLNPVSYDEARAFVVIARTEESARNICYDEAGHEIDECPDYWTNAEYSNCKKIGVSWERNGERLVLRDFYEA